MQGVKGGEDRKPESGELDSDVCQQMRKAGFDRAQAEEYQKKGMLETLQENTSKIKDAAAEKMDQLGISVKSAVSSEK